MEEAVGGRGVQGAVLTAPREGDRRLAHILPHPREGHGDGQGQGMEGMPLHQGGGFTVEIIPQDGMPQMGEMHP
jgi:hypothetical protein